jgi:RNA polymerase sigma-70 factor (ECF subfamily)
MSDRSDGALVRACVAGERSAYGELVRRHQDRLHRRARALVDDPDTAADMVQEGLVRGYTRLEGCQDPDRFGGWVSTIVRNLCLDHIRSPRSGQQDIDDLPLAESVGGGPEERLEAADARQAIEAALRMLPPLLREAFVLKHVEGLSYGEMAEETGGSESALKMRVKRAREALQEALEAYEPAA